MKTLKSLLILLAMALMAACDKNDTDQGPDLPCFGSFSCEINGEPFETSGSASCQSKRSSYDSIQNILMISGTDCRIKRDGFAAVVFNVHNFSEKGICPLLYVNCGYVDDQGRPVHYNVEVGGEVEVTSFIEHSYSEDYSGGYVEGTFWFTAYNKDTFDTVYVTNGRFCGRI